MKSTSKNITLETLRDELIKLRENLRNKGGCGGIFFGEELDEHIKEVYDIREKFFPNVPVNFISGDSLPPRKSSDINDDRLTIFLSCLSFVNRYRKGQDATDVDDLN